MAVEPFAIVKLPPTYNVLFDESNVNARQVPFNPVAPKSDQVPVEVLYFAIRLAVEPFAVAKLPPTYNVLFCESNTKALQILFNPDAPKLDQFDIFIYIYIYIEDFWSEPYTK